MSAPVSASIQSAPVTPVKPDYNGIIAGYMGKKDQLQAYTLKHKAVLTLTKHYLHLLIATQDAFPDMSHMSSFTSSVLELAQLDWKHKVQTMVENQVLVSSI